MAVLLTITATPQDAERYRELTAIFMETWKTCVVGLIGIVGGSRLRG